MVNVAYERSRARAVRATVRVSESRPTTTSTSQRLPAIHYSLQRVCRTRVRNPKSPTAAEENGAVDRYTRHGRGQEINSVSRDVFRRNDGKRFIHNRGVRQ